MPKLTSSQRQRMRGAIAALPEPTRSVYLAHRVEGLGYREIGEREHLGVRAVERHIAEAIMLIDRNLRAFDEQPE